MMGDDETLEKYLRRAKETRLETTNRFIPAET
jgi:hypothetical protein